MMLKLYNTLTRREEEFIPLDPARKVVTMYTCGPTVYGRPHIGNYASFLMADLLRRWLEAGHGYHVRQVKNITDVGHLLHDADEGVDKIQRQAEAEKLTMENGELKRGSLKGKSKRVKGIVTREDVLAVVERYTQQYICDEKALNFCEPDARPRASDFIKEQLALVQKLLASGHAYDLPDGIYFSVESRTLTPYGTLSGNTLDQLSSGSRVEVHTGKKHPADFALWKRCIGHNSEHILRWAEATGEISHTTGDDKNSGFPGWHIECSAMASSLLGRQIDIHTGGEDNIFPHHECEIAQSESALGIAPFVSLWIHRRRIQMGEEKMSKSLGNVLTLPDIIAQGFSPMDLRYYLLSVHYRTNLQFTEKGLQDARATRKKIAEWIAETKEGKETKEPKEGKETKEPKEGKEIEEPKEGKEIEEYVRRFTMAMDSDLNVSEAMAIALDAVAMSRRTGRCFAFTPFASLLQSTFGCFSLDDHVVSSEALALAAKRDSARAAKDFAESDRLRDLLTSLGYEVRDTPEGTRITPR